jgi:methylase of polypeptide subunit release factors
MPQNTSHAVMSQRKEPTDSLDHFPTPPWATRALIEHIIGRNNLAGMHCLEPACGEGHMAKVLKDYFGSVFASDVHPYGYGSVDDFLFFNPDQYADWIITNPPFVLGREFAIRATKLARHGTALLVRTAFMESVDRYNGLFLGNPPSIVAQFVERVPMVKGRLDKTASTATSYAWLVWLSSQAWEGTRLRWIPPCRKMLEREGDYDLPKPPQPHP